MRCEDVQELLWPLEGSREAVPGEEAARAHLAGCEECQRFFRQDAEVGRLLRRVWFSQRAPSEFRERVAALVANAASEVRRLPRQRRLRGRYATWSILAAAAAVVALLASGLWPRGGGDALPGATHFAADFSRLMVEDEATPPALDPASLEDFFDRRLGYRIVPVHLDGAVITRAMICFLRGRRGARVEYELGGRRIAHYQIPLAENQNVPSSSSGWNGLRTYGDADVPVVLWTDAGYEHALVGDLPVAELRRLAEEADFSGV